MNQKPEPFFRRDSALPLHMQVERYLRALIACEEYQNGNLLPAETDLCAQMGVARGTVRAAITRLVQQGVLVRTKGVGTRVSARPISTELSRWESFTLELGDKMSTLQRTVEWLPADLRTAAELGIAQGTTVCKLTRIKGNEQGGMVALISIFPPELHIAQDEQFDGRLYAVLESKYGVRAVLSREEIGAHPPDAFLQRELKLTAVQPVLYRKRRVLDQTGALMELAYAYYRADRFNYQIDIRST